MTHFTDLEVGDFAEVDGLRLVGNPTTCKVESILGVNFDTDASIGRLVGALVDGRHHEDVAAPDRAYLLRRDPAHRVALFVKGEDPVRGLEFTEDVTDPNELDVSEVSIVAIQEHFSLDP